MLEQVLDQIVRARRQPVRPEQLVLSVEEAQDGPGVIDGLTAEDIAVVERAHTLEHLGQASLFEQRGHLGLGEAEAGVELGGEHRIDSQIIKAREDALARDAQDAREHGLEQVRVPLEALRQEGAKEVQDGRGVAVQVAAWMGSSYSSIKSTTGSPWTRRR